MSWGRGMWVRVCQEECREVAVKGVGVCCCWGVSRSGVRGPVYRQCWARVGRCRDEGVYIGGDGVAGEGEECRGVGRLSGGWRTEIREEWGGSWNGR